jgi:hypothetical protein
MTVTRNREDPNVDVVDECDVAGVQLVWLRERGADQAGHVIVLEASDGAERHGPYERAQAKLVFESMRSALLAAARQQSARLRNIVRRREGTPAR